MNVHREVFFQEEVEQEKHVSVKFFMIFLLSIKYWNKHEQFCSQTTDSINIYIKQKTKTKVSAGDSDQIHWGTCEVMW